jgi:hypothetical protein
MLRSRSGRPSLIGSAARTAGRTAVIVGTANAVSAKQRGRAQAAAPAAPAAPDAAVPASTAGGLSDDAIARLKQLAELRQSGILSDAEFEEQKARILNG